MALVPPLGYTPEQVKELLAPLRNDLTVAIWNCQNPFAVGAIIRVAHSFLPREIVIVGDEPYYEKASMGMQKYEHLVRVEDEDAFFDHVRGRPVWAVEKDHATIGLFDVEAFPRDVVFVLGSERAGLPESMIARALAEGGAVVGTPMFGVNHSYPVAVAAGMVLADWARRRYRVTNSNERPAR
jgi:tRNA G18 (ribose-2'-O)-methylase SpoU